MRRFAAALASLALSVSAGGSRALSHAQSLSLLHFSPDGRYVSRLDRRARGRRRNRLREAE
jgi:hypothetical protein